MLGATRTSVLGSILLAVLALGLSACSGDDESAPTEEATVATTPVPTGDPSSAPKSCQAIAGSGAVEDVQEIFDQYKDNSKAFTPADERAMREALDRLAKSGDNAAPEIREDVVTLVADMGAQIDSRAGLPGVGKVAGVKKIQRQLDALCS